MSPTLKRKREEVEEFEASLSCIGRICLKNVKNKTKHPKSKANNNTSTPNSNSIFSLDSNPVHQIWPVAIVTH